MQIILRNLFSLLMDDLKKVPGKIQFKFVKVERRLTTLRLNSMYYSQLLKYFKTNDSSEFRDEIAYVKEKGKISVFPYHQIKSLGNVVAHFDDKKQMPYVMHQDKRLYFPRTWDLKKASKAYRTYMEVENILGGSYAEKSPHQYQTDTFKVEQGDVVLDIGAAEGLFALEVIDRAKKVYLFEPKQVWIEPLYATFEPYSDKVVIIHKAVSEFDSEYETRLDTCLKGENVESLFIKMDIEGYEKKLIQSSSDFLKKMNNVRVACCTYHRQDDAKELKNLFNALNFETEFSDGYMLFIYDDHIQPPYFRKGIIRAQSNNH